MVINAVKGNNRSLVIKYLLLKKNWK